MQECFIVRRGGSKSGKKATTDMAKGAIQIDGSLQLIQPDIGQNVITEPYSSDEKCIYTFRNTSDFEQNVVWERTKNYVVPYEHLKIAVENIDGQGTTGYYTSDGRYSFLENVGEIEVPTVLEQNNIQEFSTNKILVRNSNVDVAVHYERHYIKVNEGLCLSFNIQRPGGWFTPILISKQENAVLISNYPYGQSVTYSFHYKNNLYYMGVLEIGLYTGMGDSSYYFLGYRDSSPVVDITESNQYIESFGGVVFQVLDMFGDYLES